MDTSRSAAVRTSRTHRAKHMGGGDVRSLVNPVHGVREAMERKGQKPRDHARENVMKMRAMQREVSAKKEADRIKEEKFKMKRFQHVESKLASTGMKRDTYSSGSASSSPRKEFLRKGTKAKMASDALPPPRKFERRGVEAKPRVPRATDVLPLAPRENTDHIKKNALKAIKGARPSSATSRASVGSTPRRGEVPAYLRERKEELAAEAAARERLARAPDCPPGMTIMPQSERLETLDVLHQSKAEVEKQLYALPLRIETEGQKRRKNALDAKMKEIESAIEIFSKDKVFIKEDS